MFELLKNLAVQKLKEKMLSNSLGAEATSAAAEEGSSELIGSLMEQVKSGNMGAVTSLFSNDGNATEENGIAQGLVGKLSGILQAKGMSAPEAQTEAAKVAPDLINGLKEKFLSNAPADSGFDIGKIGDLLGGDAGGGLLGKAKNLMG